MEVFLTFLIALINWGYALSCTKTWLGAKQVCPAIANFAHKILVAANSRSASSVTTTEFLPPSSRVTGVRCFAAAFMISFPNFRSTGKENMTKRAFE